MDVIYLTNVCFCYSLHPFFFFFGWLGERKVTLSLLNFGNTSIMAGGISLIYMADSSNPMVNLAK